MNTMFLLMAEHGAAEIPLEKIAPMFGLSRAEACKRASRQALPVPAYQPGSLGWSMYVILPPTSTPSAIKPAKTGNASMGARWRLKQMRNARRKPNAINGDTVNKARAQRTSRHAHGLLAPQGAFTLLPAYPGGRAFLHGSTPAETVS